MGFYSSSAGTPKSCIRLDVIKGAYAGGKQESYSDTPVVGPGQPRVMWTIKLKRPRMDPVLLWLVEFFTID
jgi:hypothetical protein